MSVLRVNLGEGEAIEAVTWLEGFLARYDLSRLSRLTIDHGKSNRPRRGVWGCCYYPEKGVRKGLRSTYRISCHVGNEWGCGIETRKSPLYHHNGSWTRRYSMTFVEDINEGVVWIAAHELFHFLRRTRQVEGINTEIQADAFADARLAEFRGRS